MEMIYYRGLNCYLACVMSIANALGARCVDAYANLWAETDFTYEAEYRICVSKRIFTNIEALGIRTRLLDCEGMKRDMAMRHIPDGGMFFVGMDTFDIPWHPVFGYFHGPHYFYARKEAADSLMCFDPVYGATYQKLAPEAVIARAFGLGYVYRAGECSPPCPVARDAAEVLRGHPGTKGKLISDMLQCKGDGKSKIPPMINQITAMINNRLLYSRYLRGAAFASAGGGDFFDDGFLSKWEAVRNGVYKASIVKDNSAVIDEVCALLVSLLDEEMAMAAVLLRSNR